MNMKSFDGRTFVAFIDISGFKDMMGEEEGRAWKALDMLYNTGYGILGDRYNETVCGIFVSDCGILYINDDLQSNFDSAANLKSLLDIIGKINKTMLKDDFMLTTSISYGEFKYQDRIVIPKVAKSAVYGGAYIKAYSDNDHGNPKIKPGQCRIIMDGIPKEIWSEMEKSNIYHLMKKDGQHYYYYWMCQEPNDIGKFDSNYKKAYECRYRKLCNVLRQFNKI